MNLNKTPIALALAALAGTAHLPSLAQAAAGVDAPTLPVVTVTATRTERHVDDVPNTVTVTPAAAIERSGARDIKEVFRNELDVTVRAAPSRFTTTGGSGRAGNEGINIRGLEGNQVLMLVDGIRVPNTFGFGPFTTGRGDFLAIDSAQALEVLRGPASTQYGSDGLAGAVSLRTLEPGDLLRGQDVGGFARLGHASVDTSWATTVAAAGRTGPWAALLMVTGRKGHETANQGSNDVQNANRTTPDPQTYTAPSALGKLHYLLSPAHRLGLTVEAQQRSTTTEAYSARAATTTPAATSVIDLDTRDKLERWRVSLAHRYADAAAPWMQEAQTQVYAQNANVRQTAAEDRSTAADRTRDNRYAQKIVGLSTQLESRFTGALPQRLTYGVDLSRSEITGLRSGTVAPAGETFPAKPFPDTTYTLAGAFVQSEVETGDFSIIPGLRLDHYKLDPSTEGYSATVATLSDQAVTPRLGVVWRWHELFAPYGQVAKGFRAPTPDQVNNSFTNTTQRYKSISNAHLKAERADSLELGIRGRLGGLAYSLAGYDNRYKDFISQESFIDPADGLTTFQYVNLAEARIRGIEVRADWQVDRRWSVNAGSALSRGYSKAPAGSAPINSVEPLRTALGARYDTGAWELRADLLHSQGKGADRTVPVATQTGTTPAFAPTHYTVLDLGATWKPLPRLSLNANLNNVFDQTYWRWSDVRGLAANNAVLDAYTAPGRNLQVAARYDF